MNKLDILLNRKQSDILSIFFTAGYPKLEDTNSIIENLSKHGADLIEIGIPFSDPVADGKVIQNSNQIALNNGISITKIFQQLETLKQIETPLILMGYFNPILSYGVKEFCKKCSENNIAGVIIPDLPIDEFNEKYKQIFNRYSIHFILLITPQTSNERLQSIEDSSTSFIYAVSTNSTTGTNKSLENQNQYFNKLKHKLSKPYLFGFGIHDKQTFDYACQNANGAIVGSAFINAISNNAPLEESIKTFINKIKN